MTEIISSNSNRKQKKGLARPPKHSLRIDMTPMVDLGFLLITFFIFTSTMSQPAAMNLFMPKEGGEPMPVKESGSLTLLPAEDGRVYYYEGFYKGATIRSCSMSEIRRVIMDKKGQTPEKDFFVVIKPSNKAAYGPLVQILDEMTIANVKRFALADITPQEESHME